MHESRKRKRHLDNSVKSKRGHHRNDLDDSDFRGHRSHNPEERARDSILPIQAHEADLRRGPYAQELAGSLEVIEDFESGQHSPPSQPRPPEIGSALIRWAGGSGYPTNQALDDQEDTISLGTQHSVKSLRSVQDTLGIWVDRDTHKIPPALAFIADTGLNKYDARLLLDSLPDVESSSRYTTTQSLPGSPSGWSDLPSDTEETFYFSPEEAEDFRNEKRRRLLELAQEERVKARLNEEKEMAQEDVDEEPWGDSDEEPDDAQKEFMWRTATHLLSSPNLAQLEMRILANHGADKRFAFLKGRWSHAWLLTKAKVRMEKEEKERNGKEEREKGLGMLAGYDSDSDSDLDGGSDRDAGTNAQIEVKGGAEKANEAVDEMKKELRRQKAKEWAEKRRAHASVAEPNE